MPIIGGGSGGGGAGAVTLLSDTTLGADTASFDITGISPNFKHLQLLINARATNAAAAALVQLRFNNDSAANYDFEYAGIVNGAGTTFSQAAATFLSLGDCPGATATAGYASAIVAFIPNYLGTAFNKQVNSTSACITGTAAASFSMEDVAGNWRTVGTAINRITVFPSAGNFLTGSRCSLYGLN